MIRRPVFPAGPEEFDNLQGLLIQSPNGLHQFSKVQFPGHQFDWKVRSDQIGERWLYASVQFSSVHSVHFTDFFARMRNRSQSRSRQSRHISAGAGAVGTFFSEPEPEPSKVVSAPAPKERKNHTRKIQNVKRENTESIIFIAQFLPFSRTGELE